MERTEAALGFRARSASGRARSAFGRRAGFNFFARSAFGRRASFNFFARSAFGGGARSAFGRRARSASARRAEARLASANASRELSGAIGETSLQRGARTNARNAANRRGASRLARDFLASGRARSAILSKRANGKSENGGNRKKDTSLHL